MKLLTTACLLSVLLVSPAHAANTQDNSILEDSYITTQEFVTARVVRIKRGERLLVVKGENQGDVREFFVPENAEITIRGKKARLSDVRRGDEVLVTMLPKTERIVIAKIRVPETPMTLEARRADPVIEELPTVLPQTASQWYGVLFLGLAAFVGAACLRLRKAK